MGKRKTVHEQIFERLASLTKIYQIPAIYPTAKLAHPLFLKNRSVLSGYLTSCGLLVIATAFIIKDQIYDSKLVTYKFSFIHQC